MKPKKMKPKNKYASPEPFSLAICNRLRWCVGRRAELLAERAEQFQKRDTLRNQVMQLVVAKASDADVLKAKSEAWDAERRLDELKLAIKFYAKTIAETVQGADSPELDGFVDETPEPLPAPPPKPRDQPKKREEVEVGVELEESRRGQ